ncbi:TCF3 fusion partner homolog [Toxorhynchites rutilus septentrionalis]|uniref:TCF3 fusion partner homolog n=1 Tax=Toxorhynchites rutilus septentrionalis TaxID=329112 RepID=UPI0024797334|nr:TCF3 fusion partner homolog [Toxorhynchites rutilus septentrionalis]
MRRCSVESANMTSGKPSKSQSIDSGTTAENGHQLFSEAERNEQYRKGVRLLQERCKAIQKNNERIVHRLHMVKKMIKRRSREVEIVKNRLDRHNDGWRTATVPLAVKLEESKADD